MFYGLIQINIDLIKSDGTEVLENSLRWKKIDFSERNLNATNKRIVKGSSCNTHRLQVFWSMKCSWMHCLPCVSPYIKFSISPWFHHNLFSFSTLCSSDFENVHISCVSYALPREPFNPPDWRVCADSQYKLNAFDAKR